MHAHSCTHVNTLVEPRDELAECVGQDGAHVHERPLLANWEAATNGSGQAKLGGG